MDLGAQKCIRARSDWLREISTERTLEAFLGMRRFGLGLD